MIDIQENVLLQAILEGFLEKFNQNFPVYLEKLDSVVFPYFIAWYFIT